MAAILIVLENTLPIHAPVHDVIAKGLLEYCGLSGHATRLEHRTIYVNYIIYIYTSTSYLERPCLITIRQNKWIARRVNLGAPPLWRVLRRAGAFFLNE